MNASAHYESDTTKRTFQKRQIGHCRKCDFTLSRLVTIHQTKTTTYGLTGMKIHTGEIIEGDTVVYCNCGLDGDGARIVVQNPVHMQFVQGRTTKTPCDERCTEAKGHKCECACGGVNHGRSFVEVAA